MYSYNIAKEADKKAFNNICAVIEANHKGIKKEQLLVDVDGSQIQIYNSPDGKIKVYNDYEVDAVYIDSDIDLKGVINE
jgi:hypothetical protein